MKHLLWVFVLLIFFKAPSLALGTYEKGTIAFEQGDYETALREFKALAVKNDSRGQYGLGLMYDMGTGVPIDFKEAVKWYRLSAKQGNAGAQNNLATMLEEGEGVKKDSNEAAKWYELSAQKGNFDAPNNLGIMYLQGIGITRDYIKAYMWFHLGEMKGDRAAKRNRKFTETKMNPKEVIEANRRVSEWIQKYGGL
jgi:hypothetical protein